jgi:DNA polymerase-3 subunit alpha
VVVSARDRALWEKEVLGFQFGDHPFMEAAAWLANRVSHDTSQITMEASGEKVVLAGLVTGVRRLVTRTKSQMAVVTLEDLHGTVEAVVFPRLYEKNPEVFREDSILVVEGKVDTRAERPQLVVDRAEEWTRPEGEAPPPPPPIRAAPLNRPAPRANGSTNSNGHGHAAGGNGATGGNGANGNAGAGASANGEDGAAHRRVLRIDVPRGEDDSTCLRVLEQLHGLVERFPGKDAIELVLRDRGGQAVELSGAEILVQHSLDLEAQVRGLVGEENVRVR